MIVIADIARTMQAETGGESVIPNAENPAAMTNAAKNEKQNGQPSH